MSETTAESKPTIYPALRYDDASAAIEWLEKAFGFVPGLVVKNPDDSVAHAELRLGPGVIMLGTSRDDGTGASPRRLKGVTGSIYVYVADVDALHQRAAAAGAEVMRRPEDTEYGSREFTAKDLEGHVWSFGTYQP